MEIIVSASICTFAVINAATALNLTPSLEGKVDVGSMVPADNISALHNMISQFRWLASIVRYDQRIGRIKTPRCIGLIVSPMTIVLPACCLYNLKDRMFYKPVMAEINFRRYYVIRPRKHPEYSSANPDAKYFDIAVASMSADTNIENAPLPRPCDVFYPGTRALMFGMTTQNHVHKVAIQLSLLDKRECYRRLRYAINLKHENRRNFLCAEKITQVVTLTESDIGSPVAQECQIVGLVSGEFYNKVPNTIVLTNLYEHLDFIEGIKQKLEEVTEYQMPNIGISDYDALSASSEESGTY